MKSYIASSELFHVCRHTNQETFLRAYQNARYQRNVCSVWEAMTPVIKCGRPKRQKSDFPGAYVPEFNSDDLICSSWRKEGGGGAHVVLAYFWRTSLKIVRNWKTEREGWRETLNQPRGWFSPLSLDTYIFDWSTDGRNLVLFHLVLSYKYYYY